MRLMHTELLAVAAAVALIVGTGGVHAQQTTTPKMEQGQSQPGGGSGGTSVQKKDNGKSGLDARGGAQAQGPDRDMKTQGGGQAQGTSPSEGGGPDVQKKGKTQTGAPMRDSKQRAQDRPSQQQRSGQRMERDEKQQRSGQRMERDEQQRSGQRMERGEQDRAGQRPEGGGAKVQLSQQQRTRISQSIQQNTRSLRRIERSRINFTVNVGAVVPRTVELHPLPSTIVSVVPAYRGYLYIVVDEELLIIDPQTYEIVAVIEA